jgi:hypothetical protein
LSIFLAWLVFGILVFVVVMIASIPIYAFTFLAILGSWSATMSQDVIMSMMYGNWVFWLISVPSMIAGAWYQVSLGFAEAEIYNQVLKKK